jgi:hypothetical protein
MLFKALVVDIWQQNNIEDVTEDESLFFRRVEKRLIFRAYGRG